MITSGTGALERGEDSIDTQDVIQGVVYSGKFSRNAEFQASLQLTVSEPIF